MSKKLKIKLKGSMIGRREDHRRTVRALGLRKVNSEIIQDDTPQIRGMIHKISYLLEVEELHE